MFYYCIDELTSFLGPTSSILFIPYAYPDHDAYTRRVANALIQTGAKVTGAHEWDGDGVELRRQFNCIFCGGGNTFLLLSELYRRDLLDRIRVAVTSGVKYLGSSAGANVACPTIGTTNDFPIIQPLSLTALNLIPFNINPHYIEFPDSVHHMGETRRERIKEFILHNHRDVLAMREGAVFRRDNASAWLTGRSGAILFTKSGQEKSIAIGDDLSSLL